MTAVLAVAPVPRPGRQWAPLLDLARYDRGAALSEGERDALALLAEHRYRWPAGTTSALERLIGPIDEALDVIASDPAPGQPVDHKALAGLDYFVPNESEAETITGMPVRNLDDAKNCAACCKICRV